MKLIDELTKRWSDAKADYETKRATTPDMFAAQAAMNTFRAEHAETKRIREAEFSVLQSSARILAEAKADVDRAFRALCRAEEKQAADARRESRLGRRDALAEEKRAAEAAEDAQNERVIKQLERQAIEASQKPIPEIFA